MQFSFIVGIMFWSPLECSPVKSLMLVVCSDLSTSISMLDRFQVHVIIM